MHKLRTKALQTKRPTLSNNSLAIKHAACARAIVWGLEATMTMAMASTSAEAWESSWCPLRHAHAAFDTGSSELAELWESSSCMPSCESPPIACRAVRVLQLHAELWGSSNCMPSPCSSLPFWPALPRASGRRVMFGVCVRGPSELRGVCKERWAWVFSIPSPNPLSPTPTPLFPRLYFCRRKASLNQEAVTAACSVFDSLSRLSELAESSTIACSDIDIPHGCLSCQTLPLLCVQTPTLLMDV